MGQRVNKVQLAEILGVSERSLTEWQKEGMPLVYDGDRGESNEYDTAAVITWWINREKAKASLETPRDKLYLAQERLAQLQISEKEGALVSVAELEQAYSHLVLTCRQRLLAIPGRLAPLLETTAGMDNKRALLAEAVDEALAELSNYEPSSRGIDQAPGGADGATVAKNGGSVGGGEALPE